jgi:hypothetical protein
MRSPRRFGLPAEFSLLPSLKKAAESIWCPDCQSHQIRRSRTRGIIKFLLASLRIRPYRCKECDYRFFRWSLPHQPKSTRLARTTNARDWSPLTPPEMSQS